MAQKKIGAFITLDGEREFKQNVTSCNKSLSSLKSEMSLTKAECEGQQNSLESLGKKHEILQKILEEQVKKQDAVQKGLEHAENSYKSAGTELEKYRNDLISAKSELEKMKSSSQSSEEEIEKQKTTVLELSKAVEKGAETYQKAGNRVSDWETKLNTAKAQVIKANAEVNKNASYMGEAEKATDQCATSIDNFGKEVKKQEKVILDWKTIVKANLVDTAVDAGKEIAKSLGGAAVSIESAQKQLQATTGATTAEMKKYNEVMGKLHESNYGGDIEDVASSMAMVKQYMGEIDPSTLQKVTENGIAMRDVFDMDLSETIRGADAIVKNFGEDADYAFDLMAKGAQKGLNKSGELGDNIAEYSQLWSQAGFSAKEMFAIMQNGIDSGAYNLDKVNDFVKEFTISLSDGRIEKNLSSFSGQTKNLFYQWKQGKTTSKDVFYSVVNDLAKAENKQEALTTASSTWSALGEDNAMKVITSLAEVNSGYDNVRGTMEKVKDIKYDTLESRIQSLGKKFQTEVGEPIAEKALPLLEDGTDVLIDNMDKIIPLVKTAAAGFAAWKIADIAVSGTKAIMGMAESMKAAKTAQETFNTAAKLNPYVLGITVFVTAVAGLSALADEMGEVSEEAMRLAEENESVVESAEKVRESANDAASAYKDNISEIDAQTKYTEKLVEKIEDLAGKTNLSNSETEVMRGYIAELNELVPELNLNYDEQTGALNKTNNEIERHIELNRQELEVQAIQEQASELMKHRVELEVENIKLEESGNEIKKERNALLEEESGLATTNLALMGLHKFTMADESKTYEELTKQITSNQEATNANDEALKNNDETMEAVKQRAEEMGFSIDFASGTVYGNTDALNANSEAASNNAGTQQAASEIMMQSASGIAETYIDMQQKVSEVLESQMNMFEEFNVGTQLSTETLLGNMQSQITGVTNWADNVALLADRGINQNLLQYLSELGPEGAGYVQTFASMSDEELKKASELWKESLDMKEGVDESVQNMLTEYTTAVNGGKDQISDTMESLGVDINQGLVNGMQSLLSKVRMSGQETGQAAIEGVESGADTHSPSKKTTTTGRNVDGGLVLGMNQDKNKVSDAGKEVSNALIKKIDETLSAKKFTETGKNIPVGIKSGITNGRKQAEQEAIDLADSIGEKAGNIKSLRSEGKNVSKGLAKGIRDGKSDVINAVEEVCKAAIRQGRETLDIHSPSGVFDKMGNQTAEGWENGYSRRMGHVRGVVEQSLDFTDIRAGVSELSAAQKQNSGESDEMMLAAFISVDMGKKTIQQELANVVVQKISKQEYMRRQMKGGRYV